MTEGGEVENRVIAIPKGLMPSALVEATNYLNARLRGKTFEESKAILARARLNIEIPEYMDHVFNVCSDKFFQLQVGAEEFIDCLATSSALSVFRSERRAGRASVAKGWTRSSSA